MPINLSQSYLVLKIQVTNYLFNLLGKKLSWKYKMKQFKIGALVGMIVAGDVKDAKPFLIGSKKEFIAPATGRLLLVISDVDPSDNRGKMAVQIESTFAK